MSAFGAAMDAADAAVANTPMPGAPRNHVAARRAPGAPLEW